MNAAFALALVLFGLLLMLVRVPLAIAIAIPVFVSYLNMNLNTIDFVMDIYQSLDSFPLLAIPMFVLAGNIMATGGVARRILDLMDEIFGNMFGGLAIVTIFSSVLFGGLSGSAPATTAAVGSITIPEMIRKGYERGFAAGIAASSGIIAILIPPSNPMIIYALNQHAASVSTMFLAGIIPGILFGICMAIPCYLVARKKGWRGDTGKVRNFSTFIKALMNAKWAMMAPIIILGGIYTGVFTPTESAAVACLYSYLVGVFIHRDLKIKDTYKVLAHSAVISVVAMFTIPFAVALGKLLTSQQIPVLLTEWMVLHMNSYFSAIMLITALLLFVGTFMDTLASIIILTPLLYPVMQSYGMTIYHFGIFLIMGLGIGFVTPPLGGNLFIAKQISDTPIQKVFIGTLPAMLGMLVCLMLIAFVPILSNIFVP